MQDKLTFRQQIKVLFWALSMARRANPIAFPAKIILELLLSLERIVYLWVSALLVDDVITNISNNAINDEIILRYLVVYLVTHILFSLIIRPLYNLASNNINLTASRRFDIFMAQKASELGIEASENPEFSNLRLRVSREINTLDRMIDIVSGMIVASFQALSFGLILITLSPLFLVIYILGLLYTLPTRKFRKQMFKLDYDNTEPKRVANNSLNVLSDQKMLPDIKVMGLNTFFLKKFDDLVMNSYVPKVIKVQRNWEMVGTAFSTILLITSLFFYYQIFQYAIQGVISPGQIVFFIGNLDNMYGSVINIFSKLANFQERALRLNEAVKFFEQKPTIIDGQVVLPRLAKSPEIEIKNASFKYPNSTKFVYKNLNLKINAGEKLAIVGANGAGKSTLVKLITRFHDVQKGEILINGENIKNLKLDDWYKNVGLLLQEFNIFGFLSVKENVAIGKIAKDIDEKKVIDALKKADAWDFVKEYKNGIDELLNSAYKNGTKPSTGQSQKIAIARFFYRDSPLVIFDEPTASIDAISEAKIFDNIYSSFDDKTVIIISHRFSTVKKADRIVVVDKGEIIEQGTHAELMKLDGVYAYSYKLQSRE